MDNITQGIIGWALFTLTTKKYSLKQFLLWWLIANIPDIDTFIAPLIYSHPIDQLFFHRGIMHSVLWWSLIALLSSITLSWYHHKLKDFNILLQYFWATFLTIFGGHLCIDRLTSYGMRWRLPWSGVTTSLDRIFVVDLGMRTVLLILFLRYCFSHRRMIVSYSIIVWAWLYFVFCGFSKSLASKHIMSDFDSQFPQERQNITSYLIMPEPLQPLLRRSIIKTNTWIYEWRYSIVDESSQSIYFRAIPLWIDPKILLSQLTGENYHQLQKILSFSRWFVLIQQEWSWYSIDNLIFWWINGWNEASWSKRMFGFVVHSDGTITQYNNPSSRSLSHIDWEKFWLRVRWKNSFAQTTDR